MGDDDSGFMEFAEGWNETVSGWGDDIAGTAKQIAGKVIGDEELMLEGVVQDAEGDGQTERGHNLMVGGINEMLGLVDHGDQPSDDDGAGGGAPYSAGGGGGPGTPEPEYDDLSLPQYNFEDGWPE